MTLFEMMIAVAILGILMVMVNSAIFQGLRQHGTLSTAMNLEEEGRRAVERIARELRTAGITYHPSHPGNLTWAYPYIWTGNAPGGPYTALTLDPGTEPVDTLDPVEDAGDDALGDNESIVFVMPVVDTTMALGSPASDGLAYDDNGTPSDASDDTPLPFQWSGGELEVLWGARHPEPPVPLAGGAQYEVWYALVRHPSGEYNTLQRRVYDGASGAVTSTKEIARHVERIEIASYVQGGVDQMSHIQVTVYLRRRDPQGNWMRADVSAVVAMRSLKVYP
jgi:prepilin-type N-terminal cleavage/methylation domain-containing protein